LTRKATEADREALHELYGEFFAERPPAAYFGVSLEGELGEVDEIVRSELAFVAEQDGGLVGFALAKHREGSRAHLTDIYVRPEARRQGVATELMRAVAEALGDAGVTHVTLSVEKENERARAVYDRWGFRERVLQLVAELDALDLTGGEPKLGPSFGSVHVQTDDVTAVVKAVRPFIPRLPGHSQGSVVAPPRNGWIAVYDELCDREPELLRRLGRELSDRMGAVVLSIGVERGEVVRYLLYERGRMVDEYLSVPEHYGELPPGDVIALGANPTVVARLTGADRQRIRAVARTAPSPSALPPAQELLADIADAMRIEGADHGYAEAVAIPGAEVISPG
jgi:ribosomal protein S18 acetylase RimI-like enzyme